MNIIIIVVVSAICSFLNTFLYETLAKRDTVLKELNKELVNLRNKIKQIEFGSKEFLEVQKKLLELSKEMMTRSIPKTIVAGVPSYIILILGITYFNLFPDWLSILLFIMLSMIFSAFARKIIQVKGASGKTI